MRCFSEYKSSKLFQFLRIFPLDFTTQAINLTYKNKFSYNNSLILCLPTKELSLKSFYQFINEY